MEKFELKRDEIGILPSSVELLVNNAIRDLIKSGVEGNETLDIIIKKYNNIGVPSETLLKFLFDYCKDDFNIREFLSDIYRTELNEANQITDDHFIDYVVEIRNEYFAKKGNFSKFEGLLDVIEDDINRIDKDINRFYDEQDKLPDPYDENDDVINKEAEAKFDKLDDKISLFSDRRDELNDCKYHLSDYISYSNEEMKELELAVYGYINSKILSVQTLNQNDFYSLFNEMISKEGWNTAPESLQYEIMRKIVEFAKTKGVQVDFNKLLEINENTNSKKM